MWYFTTTPLPPRDILWFVLNPPPFESHVINGLFQNYSMCSWLILMSKMEFRVCSINILTRTNYKAHITETLFIQVKTILQHINIQHLFNKNSLVSNWIERTFNKWHQKYTYWWKGFKNRCLKINLYPHLI